MTHYVPVRWECGCEFTINGDDPSLVKWHLCPLHAAAGELAEALRAVADSAEIQSIRAQHSQPYVAIVERARAALAKAGRA